MTNEAGLEFEHLKGGAAMTDTQKALDALDRLENDALSSRDGYGSTREDAELIRAALEAKVVPPPYVANPDGSVRQMPKIPDGYVLVPYQKALGTATQAIEFAIEIDDHFDRLGFLEGWTHGDVPEWPEYSAMLAAPAPKTVPDEKIEKMEEALRQCVDYLEKDWRGVDNPPEFIKRARDCLKDLEGETE